jgi:predicted RNase H-like HicB family nuclease
VSNQEKYPAHIFWNDEDEGYIALAPDLPGCSAFGGTQEEALGELQHAILAWKEAAAKAGNPIPDPSRPEAEPAASGKVLLRLPRSLHAQLIKGAKRDRVSLNQYIVSLLSTASAGLAVKQVIADVLRDFQGSYWHLQRNFQQYAVSGDRIGTVDFRDVRQNEDLSSYSAIYMRVPFEDRDHG